LKADGSGLKRPQLPYATVISNVGKYFLAFTYRNLSQIFKVILRRATWHFGKKNPDCIVKSNSFHRSDLQVGAPHIEHPPTQEDLMRGQFIFSSLQFKTGASENTAASQKTKVRERAHLCANACDVEYTQKAESAY